jgi:hypothetical protein
LNTEPSFPDVILDRSARGEVDPPLAGVDRRQCSSRCERAVL